MSTEKEQLVARAAALRAERNAIGNPMYAAVVAARQSTEEAAIDRRLAEIDAAPPPGIEQELRAVELRQEHAKLDLPAAVTSDLLVKAKRAEVRAARERLEAENPIAAAAFVQRNAWAFMPSEDER